MEFRKGIIFAAISMSLYTAFAKASDPEISPIFTRYGIEGAIIVASLDGRVVYVHNEERAESRFLPASTFKIPNSLIALEEAVIQDEQQLIEWDGRDKGWEPWNKDQTLQTAFALSCVWCYQEFAKRIGDKRYIEYLDELDYGNGKTGKDVTTFWLEGDLAISAREQIGFLRKLYLEALPFKIDNIRLLKKTMVVEATPTYTLSAKTGWASRVKDQHGWYVGYLEAGAEVWLFANNIEIRTRDDLHYRKRIVMESLKAKGIID